MTRPVAESPAVNVDALIIGAGHTGLAISHCLAEHSVEHAVLERGEVANSWRYERWDSLRLLTPNWQSNLPGFPYSGNNPDGFMTNAEVIDFISKYAKFIEAPVRTKTTVTSVRYEAGQYHVTTDKGIWLSNAVVIASGACNLPAVPAIGNTVPENIVTLTPHDYRNPKQLEQGGVLIVGASATGLQLADEIQSTGRSVTIAVGEHVRLPRVYRGLDIQWWMDKAGILDESIETIDDIVRARNLPSPQLVGSREKQILDLNSLTALGVKLVGRLMSFRDSKAYFSGSLRNVCALADLKMGRLLDTIDEWATNDSNCSEFERPERFERTRVEESPPLSIDFEQNDIRTILWATGYRPDYSWLNIPVLDRKGRIRHDGGIVDSPGLYVIGLPFLRRRKSSFIQGTEDDAIDISDHLAKFLETRRGTT
ncbi:MAG: NAD(P)-binding domain-containing protein [Candidatus Rariloculaceae bacterium]